MNNYTHLIDFLKKYAPLSSLGALTYDTLGAMTSATGTSLTVEKDKNYSWIPANANELTLSAESNSDSTYHKANILLDLSRGNTVNFGSGISCNFNSLKSGEVNLITIEWYGSGIVASLENGVSGGSEAGDFVLSVKAMGTVGNSTAVIAEACGNYWDTGYKNSNCATYTNGVYSLYLANGLGTYCIGNGVADSDGWYPSESYVDCANGNYGAGAASLSAHEYVNGSIVWPYGKSAAPGLTATSGTLTFVNGTAATQTLDSFYTATNATSVSVANSGSISLPAGLSFTTSMGIPAIGGTPTGGESSSSYSLTYRATNNYGSNDATANLSVVISLTPAGPPNAITATVTHPYAGTSTYTMNKGSTTYNGKQFWVQSGGSTTDPDDVISGKAMYNYITWENNAWTFYWSQSSGAMTNAGSGDYPTAGTYAVSLGMMGDVTISLSF